MLLFLYCFLILANLYFALRRKSSKLLAVISLVFIGIVFVGSRNVVDLDNYMSLYAYGPDNIWRGGQVLFYQIVQICRSLHMSFDTFRLVITIIGLSFYYFLISRFSPLPNFVLAAYLAYSMIMDDVQIRNFWGCSFFCIALSFLLMKARHWRLKFSIAIICASFIHSSFWIYLIFLIIPLNDTSNYKFVKDIAYLAIIFSVIAFFMRNLLNDSIMFMAFVDEEKFLSYSEKATRYGGLVYSLLHLFITMSIFYIRNNLRLDNKNNLVTPLLKDRIDVNHVIDAIFLMDLLALICVPAVIFSITFYRLFRNLILMNVIGISIGVKCMKKRYIPMMMGVLYIAVFYYFDLTSYERIEMIIKPFFNDNLFF